MFQMNGVSFSSGTTLSSYRSFQTLAILLKMLISCMFNTILLVHVRLAESIAHSVFTNVIGQAAFNGKCLEINC
jgi:hypothetical protein